LRYPLDFSFADIFYLEEDLAQRTNCISHICSCIYTFIFDKALGSSLARISETQLAELPLQLYAGISLALDGLQGLYSAFSQTRKVLGRYRNICFSIHFGRKEL
jgi:hypothetical protein